MSSKQCLIAWIAIRVEWGKSRARAQRYQEEIKLVEEEMNRTLRFFDWKAADWRKKGAPMSMEPLPPGYAEGLRAYAERQAALCQSLRDSFEKQWKGVPALIQTANEEMQRPELFYQRKQREFEQRKKKTDKIFTMSSMPSLPVPPSTNEPVST
jgi:hypothetical protein